MKQGCAYSGKHIAGTIPNLKSSQCGVGAKARNIMEPKRGPGHMEQETVEPVLVHGGPGLEFVK